VIDFGFEEKTKPIWGSCRNADHRKLRNEDKTWTRRLTEKTKPTIGTTVNLVGRWAVPVDEKWVAQETRPALPRELQY